MIDNLCCKQCENFILDLRSLEKKCEIKKDGEYPYRFKAETTAPRWCPKRKSN